MRIIAGSAGGRPLQAPPEGVRPTMDRVKGAVFSSLGDLVPNARVLDLFAGSGGMGIEALSRGAASATLVDSNAQCIRCIRENLRRAGVSASVQAMDVYRFLDLYAAEGAFDLIIADPPYTKEPDDADHANHLTQSEKLAQALSPSGVFVLERKATRTPSSLGALALRHSKKYGDSEILYFGHP